MVPEQALYCNDKYQALVLEVIAVNTSSESVSMDQSVQLWPRSTFDKKGGDLVYLHIEVILTYRKDCMLYTFRFSTIKILYHDPVNL